MNFNEFLSTAVRENWPEPRSMHPEQTEDNESRFLIESPVPCSGINSNYAAPGHAPSVDLEFMQSFQNLHCP